MICCTTTHCQRIRLFLITRNSIRQHYSRISQGQGYQNATVDTNSTRLIGCVSTASKVYIHLIHKVIISFGLFIILKNKYETINYFFILLYLFLITPFQVTINVSPVIPMLAALVGTNQLSTKDSGEAPSTVIKYKSAVATLNTVKPLVRIHNLTHASQATLAHYAKPAITQQCTFQTVILIALSAKTTG